MAIVKGKIGNALTSTAADHVVAVTHDIYDDTLEMYQDDINQQKVDKIAGKQLSTEDYTTTEKSKLSGIANNAQVNVIESIKKNGTSLSVTEKSVDITVPTKTSDIDNDSEFITAYIEGDTLVLE